MIKFVGLVADRALEFVVPKSEASAAVGTCNPTLCPGSGCYDWTCCQNGSTIHLWWKRSCRNSNQQCYQEVGDRCS